MKKNNLSNYNCIDLSIGDTDFSILFAPDFQSGNVEWNATEHLHLFCECHFLISGKVRISTSKEEICFGANSFCIIPRGIRHSITSISEQTKKISFYVAISQNKHTQNSAFSWYEQIFFSETPFVTDKLKPLFTMLFEIIQSQEAMSFIKHSKLSSLLSLVFLELAQQKEQIKPLDKGTSTNYDYELALKIENYLIDNCYASTSLDDLAEYLCLSQRQTGRLLKNFLIKAFKIFKKKSV